jgi:hypothetical protein
MDVYATTAGKLGVALGVPEHMHRIFGGEEGAGGEGNKMLCKQLVLVTYHQAATVPTSW